MRFPRFFPYRPSRSARRRGGSRGQSAVETMLVMPIIMMVFTSMYYLFTITFASQNAHIRAREYALHESTYMGDRAYQVSGGSVWDSSKNNYKKADSDLNVTAQSTDRSIPGTGTSGRSIKAKVYLK